MCFFSFLVFFVCAETCFGADAHFGDRGDGAGPQARPACFGREDGFSPRSRHRGWVARAVTSKRFADSAGLASNQVWAIRREVRKIEELNQSLEAGILAATGEQARIYRDFLRDKDVDPAPLYTCAEKIAGLRGEQAKLSIRLILFIRETLDEKQFRQLDALLREEGGKRRMERVNFRNRRETREKEGNRKERP